MSAITREVIRWRATIRYRSDSGVVDAEHFIDEISELHEIVERGPNFLTILSIDIGLLNSRPGSLTLEQARAL